MAMVRLIHPHFRSTDRLSVSSMERVSDTVDGGQTGDDGDQSKEDPTELTDDLTTENQYVETIAGDRDSGSTTLVGVVHDHPASISRVRRVVEAKDPDVLALELPPLAVPLYEAHATGSESPPALGGEFSAAIQSATTDDIVGIDGPSRGFARTLLWRLIEERAPPAVAGQSLRSLLSATRTAITCRAAAWLTQKTSLRVGVGSATPHEASWMDSPDERVTDERHKIRSTIAVLDAFEPPASSQYRSSTRERHMSDRLSEVRQRGNVVAVVGAGHFAPLRAALGPSENAG